MEEEYESRLALREAQWYLKRRVRPAMEREGLKPSYGFMLRAVGCRPGCSLKDIAEMTRVDKAMVTRTASAMIADGLVEDRSDDSRVYSLHLTEKGESSLELVEKETGEAWESLMSCLEPDERAELDRLLGKLAAFVESEERR